jgi:ribosomal protein L2
MKETVKKRVEALEQATGQNIIVIVYDNIKSPNMATVNGKELTLDQLQVLLQNLPKGVKVFTVEVEPNEPFKGKVQE